MVAFGLYAPLGFGIMAIGMFILAYSYKEREEVGWFEAYFLFGNLFILGALYSIYNALLNASYSFSGTILPFFQLMLWLFVFINIVILFKVLKYIFYWIMGLGRSVFKW